MNATHVVSSERFGGRYRMFGISLKRYRRWSLAIVAVFFVVGFVCVVLRKDCVMQLADGHIEERLFAGLRIRSVDRGSVLGNLRVGFLTKPPSGEVVIADKTCLLDFGPSPSTYGGRLVTQCKTIGRILETNAADASDVERTWRAVAARAAVRGPVDDLIDDLLRKP